MMYDYTFGQHFNKIYNTKNNKCNRKKFIIVLSDPLRQIAC